MRNPLAKKPYYSLILPAYNEEQSIQETYVRLKDVMDKLQQPYEIIFVNDGSRDLTHQLLNSLHEVDSHVKVIHFSRNFGHQTAVSAGLAKCTGEYVAVLDADL